MHFRLCGYLPPLLLLISVVARDPQHQQHEDHNHQAQSRDSRYQDPRYSQRHYPDPRHQYSRRDPRYRHRHDPRVQERTPVPVRRPETARYDPRLEHFFAELHSEPVLFETAEQGRAVSNQEYTLQRRRIYTDFDELGEEKGNWTDWEPLAPCSRTCGGGVTFRQRTCLEEPCIGPTRIYSSCNTNECPEGDQKAQEMFLQQQCRRMNSVPYDDKFYSWIPRRRHDRNPCELNCTPKDREMELKHRINVIDGTRCYHAGFDQCVEGQCVSTGCDGLLGSKKRIDKCLVCGGQGKNCNTTHHTEKQLNLNYGYQPVYVIPAGATSIMMREIEPSINYFSLRDLNGTYYLNKDYEIDYSKAFYAGGTRFHYIRNLQYEDGREHLRADGPTNETLVIVLLVQEINRGYEVEYSLKYVPGQPQQRTGEYQWELGEWEPCYDPCGEVQTNRTVRCASIISRHEAKDEAECDVHKKPPSTQQCPTDNCQVIRKLSNG
ncbi:papilin-like [Tropilaelaps mercedesae]|uniref:Papilin-like n=1 Tax=Tropilaelaps mercedesae TaxID=418985 RepID=A0A1V9XA67_9ACAR|nr:papilin-like [Tropilaelaps mercedesae]